MHIAKLKPKKEKDEAEIHNRDVEKEWKTKEEWLHCRAGPYWWGRTCFQSHYQEEEDAAGDRFGACVYSEESFLIQVLQLILSALRTAAE